MKKLLYCLIILIIVSCTSNGGKVRKVGKTTISAPYELLIVADKEWLQTDEGEVLEGLFKSDIAGLIQPEANFRTMSVNPNTFTKQFRAFANIVIVKIDKKYSASHISIQKDLWAHPQTIMTISAHDGMQLAEFVATNQKQILNIFVDAELQREMSYLRGAYSDKVLRQAEKQFGYEIYVPQDIQSIKVAKNFFWASSVDRDNTLNVCMYSYPCDDKSIDSLLTLENFVAHRNAVMKANIPGEHEGQYMTTQLLGLQSECVVRNGVVTQQVRGLWEMANDAMGGSFVSYSWVDSLQKKVIVAEGFVFAPGKKKRELIRELEASVMTTKRKTTK